MRLLLDTQAVIWHYHNNPALSKKAADAIESDGNQIVISTVSIWEMTIKVGSGKLKLEKPVVDIVARYKIKGAHILPVNEEHALGVGGLPDIHRDPFDRLLVSQAKLENMTIVTVDELIQQYPVDWIW